MPSNSCEDLMPRNVPRPAPLVEVAAKPLVPEVSLLLDQDKNKSILITKTTNSTSPNIQNGTSQNKSYTNTITQQRESINAVISVGNNIESYNSWKTKNAQALHNITGSSGKIESARKIIDNSRKLDHTQNLHSRESKFHSKIHGQRSPAIKMHEKYMENKPAPASSSIANENLSYHYNHYRHSQQPQDSDNPNTLAEDQQLGYSDTRTGGMYSGCPVRDANHTPEEYYRQIQNNLPLDHTLRYRPQVDFNAHKKYLSNEFHEPARRSNNVYPEKQMTDHCTRNLGQHLYSEERFGEFPDSNNYLPANNIHTDNFQMPFVKQLSPLDNTVIDLYKIIHLQNEQILMLQQQVKQVLQIHLDCERTVKYKTECHNCCMERKVTSGNICCSSASKDNNDEKSSNRIYSSPSIDKPKRSVGVMTSSQENGFSDQEDSRVHDKDSQKVKNSTKIGLVDSSPVNQNPVKEKKGLTQKGGRAKLRSTSKPSKKRNKPDFKTNQVDNSFSLNEAEIVIRTSAEQDDVSPDNSVHVDLQDYCSSSNASDESEESETSTSNEEGSVESDSDQESSEPQLGWTFYNRVVGQVNNILKTPTPPRQEQSRKMRTATNIYGGAGESPEAENNWSKRVTFDGPILEDSDNNFPNIMQIPRFHQLKHQKGAGVNGVPGTMQDFRMYNIANGNTNHSFATLRYLERYHLLPPQTSSQVPEYNQASYQTSNKQNKARKKKSRIKNPDVYSDLNLQGHKKKSDATCSKLLDVTALKQQPKLF